MILPIYWIIHCKRAKQMPKLQSNRTQGRRRGRCRRHFLRRQALLLMQAALPFHHGNIRRIGCSGFPTERRHFPWHVQIIIALAPAAAMAHSIAWQDRSPIAAAVRQTASITRIIPSRPVPAARFSAPAADAINSSATVIFAAGTADMMPAPRRFPRRLPT